MPLEYSLKYREWQPRSEEKLNGPEKGKIILKAEGSKEQIDLIVRGIQHAIADTCGKNPEWPEGTIREQ